MTASLMATRKHPVSTQTKTLCCGTVLGNSSVTLPLSGAVLRACVVLSYTSLLKAMISIHSTDEKSEV